MERPNNPRIFGEVVSLDVWRSPFSGSGASASLYVDVSFEAQARIGRGDDPVRFRLSLRKAEIQIVTDTAGILKVSKSSIMRADSPSGEIRKNSTISNAGKIGGKIGLKRDGFEFEGSSSYDKNIAFSEDVEFKESIGPLRVRHWRNTHGYGFKISPLSKDRLVGQPWPAQHAVLKLVDGGVGRTRGEPPEVGVRVVCLREDLIIEDVDLISRKESFWHTLHPNKKLVIEQYIKDELFKIGLECGNLGDKFSDIVVADAISSEERGGNV